MSCRTRCSALCLLTLVMLAGCSEFGRTIDGSLAVVQVIETPPPIALVVGPPVIATLGVTAVPTPWQVPVPPQLVFAEPLPSPVRHLLRARLEPAGARSLDTVQSIEVELEIEGGRRGAREVSLVFVSPQGLVWERQRALIETVPGARSTATFSLPVASTFVEDQQLFGDWELRSLDEGVEQATAAVNLEGVTP